MWIFIECDPSAISLHSFIESTSIISCSVYCSFSSMCSSKSFCQCYGGCCMMSCQCYGGCCMMSCQCYGGCCMMSCQCYGGCCMMSCIYSWFYFLLPQHCTHGFPLSPSCMTFDPHRKVLFIGTTSGELRM